MRRRFFWALLAAMATTLLIVAILGGLATLAAVRDQTRTEMERQIGQIVVLLQDALTDDGVELDGAVAREVLSQAEAPNVRRVMQEAARVAGPDAQVRLVAVTPTERVIGGSLPAAVVNSFDHQAVLTGQTMATRVLLPEAGSSVEVVANSVAPIGDSGSVLAAVMTRQSDPLKLGPIIQPMLFPLIVAAAVAAVAAGRMSNWLVKRLSHLRLAAGELAAGNHDARAPVEGSDEIAEVARAFNDMADEIEAARRRESEFLMSVGHDLRTPLTTVSGYVEILEEGDLPPEEISRIALVLERETGRLRRLIEDLMLLARLESREFTIRNESVDVVAHLGETVETYRPRADAAHVTLTYESTGTGSVEVDPDRLDQVAGNLIENALRYTPEAGRVSVRVAVGSGAIRLEVADTGPGIHANDLPHIFEKFYVARKYRRIRPEGSGLGLSIVHQVVTAMGGTIEASSEHDRPGTRFQVTLPVESPADSTI
jgi:two-component system sensor histidine kinase BaeS